jgi:hypothetical protein
MTFHETTPLVTSQNAPDSFSLYVGLYLLEVLDVPPEGWMWGNDSGMPA